MTFPHHGSVPPRTKRWRVPLRGRSHADGRGRVAGIAFLAAGLALAMPRARAEDVVAYKFQDYRESGGRIAVETHGAFLEKDLGPEMRVKFEGLVDSIAGATPTGELPRPGRTDIPLSIIEERRKAWSAEVARQLGAVNVAVGAANSRESDYVSRAWSLNTRTDFNQKNTTVLAGFATASDRITVFFQQPQAGKRTNDYILGLTQLLDPNTSIQVNAVYGRATGYLSDQYKVVTRNVQFGTAILPVTFFENRPPEREKWTGVLTLNRSLPASNAAVEMSYRHYGDSFGISADNVEFIWFQKVFADRFVVQPAVRFYRQSKANFYYYDLNAAGITPGFGPPRREGPYFSSDYRLTALESKTLGLKIVWNATPTLRFDAALERYRMSGRDRVSPEALFPTATIATVGGRMSW